MFKGTPWSRLQRSLRVCVCVGNKDSTSRMGSFALGLPPPQSVINVGPRHQPWLRLLRLLATHRPAHLQREYATLVLQIGPAQPVQENSRNMGNSHSYGRHKQGEFWMEGSGQVACPQIGCMEHVNKLEGDLDPVLNQFVELKHE